MTGIEIALWDILGKKLGVPVCDLLGGRLRDRVRVYVHASTPERAHELIERGYTCFKCGGLEHPVRTVKTLREAVGDDIDLCIDVHGPPWFSVPDAIRVGQALEEYGFRCCSMRTRCRPRISSRWRLPRRRRCI